MLFQLIFSVFPTALELYMVSSCLYSKFGPIFSAVTVTTFSLYLAFTVWITQWRVGLRQELVDCDNARNGFFIDSILNHEVVKLFTNEKVEAKRFDNYLSRIQQLSIDSTNAIAMLNLGQALLFSGGLTVSLLIALQKVQAGLMTVGDLVAVNSMLLQLAIPFNFIGYTYQELCQSIVDMSYMTTGACSANHNEMSLSHTISHFLTIIIAITLIITITIYHLLSTIPLTLTFFNLILLQFLIKRNPPS